MKLSTSTKSTPFSTIQSLPVIPASRVPSAIYRGISCGRSSRQLSAGSSTRGMYERSPTVMRQLLCPNCSPTAGGIRASRPRLLMMPVVGAVLGRVDFAALDDTPLAAIEHAEEARLVALMACGAVAMLLDREQDRIRVAIDANLAHGLVVARLLALAPEPVARAREVACVPARDGLLERLAIHVGDHQEPPALVVLRDDGHDTAILFEVDFRARVFFHNESKACFPLS